MNRGAGFDGPNLAPAIGCISHEFAGAFALKNQISRGRKNAAVGGDLLLNGPALGLLNRVPGYEFSDLWKFARRWLLRSPGVRWNIDQAGKGAEAHRPPVVTCLQPSTSAAGRGGRGVSAVQR